MNTRMLEARIARLEKKLSRKFESYDTSDVVNDLRDRLSADGYDVLARFRVDDTDAHSIEIIFRSLPVYTVEFDGMSFAVFEGADEVTSGVSGAEAVDAIADAMEYWADMR